MRKNIVLMTDFGDKDNYVGLIKGVILNIAPDANILDLTHNIQAQNIKQAAFILKNSVDYFPKDTIFVAVIDPGVGSSRKAIAVKTENYYFIAPDNGLLTYVLENQQSIEIIELANKKYHLQKVSNTFHGRDIFAPVSAHISNKVPLTDLGNKIKYQDIIKIDKPYFVQHDDNNYTGEIIYSDHFGNLITSLDAKIIGINDSNKKDWTIEINHNKIKGISNSFADVNNNQLLAYIGSSDYIEIAIRNANALKSLNPIPNTKIKLYKEL